MYYHCRPLKFVEYGKIYPAQESDPDFLHAYRWLGHYCGYCPQLWLSRGNIRMTGYKHRFSGGPIAGGLDRRCVRIKKDNILFGFDLIKGFPIDYVFWCWHMLTFACCHPHASVDELNRLAARGLDQDLQEIERESRGELAVELHPVHAAWKRIRNFDQFLQEYVFSERDQLVVPSLNLKAAKIIVCRDEKQKKVLRKMGFIEDRIVIRNTPR